MWRRTAPGRTRPNGSPGPSSRPTASLPEPYRSVSYTGTGFGESEEVREAKPEEHGALPGFSSAAARYVLSQGGLPAFEKLAAGQAPVPLWVVRFFQPEKKEEWKVLVDARRGRVVGFLNPKEEAAPGGEPPAPDRARQRALAAASALGYPAAEYSVIDLGTQERPKRSDTTAVLEARPAGVGDARPRLTAVFHGDRLAAFYPSIRIPETFLREYRKRSAFDGILIAVKVVAVGGLVGLALVLFLRLVRDPAFRWRGLLAPLAVTAALAAAVAANRLPMVLRKYPTEQPFRLFLVGVAVATLIFCLGVLLLSGVGFVFFSGARPGWRRALRRGGTLADAFFRAAIAAAGLAGLSHISALAATRYPALFDPDPFLPDWLAAAIPSLSVLWSVAQGTFALAVSAAVAALAIRQPFFRTRLGAALGLAAVLAAALPAELAAPGEFLASYLPEIAVLAWLAFCALRLLADHAAAWVLFGSFALGGPLVASLLSQGAAQDRAAGAGAAVLIALSVFALIAGRRERAAAEPGPPPPALEPVA